MEETKILQIRGTANPDSTWTLDVDVIEPDPTQRLPNGIRKTYHIPQATFSSAPTEDTFTLDF